MRKLFCILSVVVVTRTHTCIKTQNAIIKKEFYRTQLKFKNNKYTHTNHSLMLLKNRRALALEYPGMNLGPIA